LAVYSSKTQKNKAENSHWSLVISKEAEAEKGRKGDRRKEAGDRLDD